MNNQSAYGLDELGRVVVAREGVFGRTVGDYAESFYRFSDDELIEYTYGPASESELLAVSLFTPYPRPLVVASRSTEYSAEQYEWDEERLVGVRSWAASLDRGETELTSEFKFTYDRQGVLTRITHVQYLPIPVGPMVVYPRRATRSDERYETELQFGLSKIRPLVDVGLRRGLLFVKDRGTYLMDPDDPSTAVWAENGPSDLSDSALSALCGADDFAHLLSSDELATLDLTRQSLRYFTVTMVIVDEGTPDDPSPRLQSFSLGTVPG